MLRARARLGTMVLRAIIFFGGGAHTMAAHRIRFWVLAGLTGLFVALAAGHWPVLNGPPWWSWPWRALDAGAVYPWTLGAGACVVAA